MSARLVFFSHDQINPFCLFLSCYYVPFYKVRALSRAARRSRGRFGEGCIEREIRRPKTRKRPVSYTHLTLPTILLV